MSVLWTDSGESADGVRARGGLDVTPWRGVCGTSVLLYFFHLGGGERIRGRVICLDGSGCCGCGCGGVGVCLCLELADDGIWELVQAAPLRDADGAGGEGLLGVGEDALVGPDEGAVAETARGEELGDCGTREGTFAGRWAGGGG